MRYSCFLIEYLIFFSDSSFVSEYHCCKESCMFRRIERPKFGINHFSYKKTRNERFILSNKFKGINVCCEIYMFCLEKFFVSKFFCIFCRFNFDNSRQNITRFWANIFIYANLNEYLLRNWYVIYLSKFANNTIFTLRRSVESKYKEFNFL